MSFGGHRPRSLLLFFHPRFSLTLPEWVFVWPSTPMAFLVIRVQMVSTPSSRAKNRHPLVPPPLLKNQGLQKALRRLLYTPRPPCPRNLLTFQFFLFTSAYLFLPHCPHMLSRCLSGNPPPPLSPLPILSLLCPPLGVDVVSVALITPSSPTSCPVRRWVSIFYKPWPLSFLSPHGGRNPCLYDFPPFRPPR